MSGRRLQRLVVSLAVLCSLAIVWAPRAFADRRENEAKAAYERGFLATEAQDFEQALEHYELSYQTVAHARTMYNIARCEEELGRWQDAISHFEEFLKLATDRDQDFRATALASIESLKKQYFGTLVVRSEPNRASVFVDGDSSAVGRTPLRFRLEPGEHEIAVVASDKRPMLRKVQVSPAKTTMLSVALGQSTIELVVTPLTASIQREGNPNTLRGRFHETLQPGRYRFHVTNEGYEPQLVELELREDTLLESHIKLEQVAISRLIIQTPSAGASVSVDGRVVGLTQLSEDARAAQMTYSVAAGEHIVTIDTGSQSLHHRVHSASGEEVTLAMSSSKPTVLRSKAVAWGLAGVGTLGVLAGGALGIHSLFKASDSTDSMVHGEARSQALLGDLLVAGGAGALLGAYYLYEPTQTSLRVESSLLADHVEAELDAQ